MRLHILLAQPPPPCRFYIQYIYVKRLLTAIARSQLQKDNLHSLSPQRLYQSNFHFTVATISDYASHYNHRLLSITQPCPSYLDVQNRKKNFTKTSIVAYSYQLATKKTGEAQRSNQYSIHEQHRIKTAMSCKPQTSNSNRKTNFLLNKLQRRQSLSTLDDFSKIQKVLKRDERDQPRCNSQVKPIEDNPPPLRLSSKNAKPWQKARKQ